MAVVGLQKKVKELESQLGTSRRFQTELNEFYINFFFTDVTNILYYSTICYNKNDWDFETILKMSTKVFDGSSEEKQRTQRVIEIIEKLKEYQNKFLEYGQKLEDWLPLKQRFTL